MKFDPSSLQTHFKNNESRIYHLIPKYNSNVGVIGLCYYYCTVSTFVLCQLGLHLAYSSVHLAVLYDRLSFKRDKIYMDTVEIYLLKQRIPVLSHLVSSYRQNAHFYSLFFISPRPCDQQWKVILVSVIKSLTAKILTFLCIEPNWGWA